MHDTFTKTYRVSDHADFFGQAGVGYLTICMQDAGTIHSEQLDIGRGDLPDGAIWVITRSRLCLNRPVLGNEELRVTTWHRGPVGVQFYRDFDLFCGDERVGEASTSWVVLNPESKRIVKPSELPQDIIKGHIPQNPKTEKLGKMLLPGDMSFVAERKTVYSDCDLNRHMNNARYLDIACDALELWKRESAFIRFADIAYHSETMPGQTLYLYTGECGGGLTAVRGDDEHGGKKFSVIFGIE